MSTRYFNLASLSGITRPGSLGIISALHVSSKHPFEMPQS